MKIVEFDDGYWPEDSIDEICLVLADCKRSIWNKFILRCAALLLL